MCIRDSSYSIFFHTNFTKKIPKQYHFLLTLFRYFMFMIPAYLLSFSCIPPRFQCLMRLHRRFIFPGRSGRRWMDCLFRSGCLGFWLETGLVRRTLSFHQTRRLWNGNLIGAEHSRTIPRNSAVPVRERGVLCLGIIIWRRKEPSVVLSC